MAGMSAIQPWFERKFSFDLPLERLPTIIERLRGTPARVEERVRAIPVAALTARVGNGWTIQENVGHLGDLELIWTTRARQILEGQDALATADLTNRATTEAGHNDARIETLCARFRERRSALVSLLEGADGAALERTARHPRLGTPMRLIDVAFFTAEHDDHHLARITELLRTSNDR
jgi:uncharacterized damage-inducible protein DinB